LFVIPIVIATAALAFAVVQIVEKTKRGKQNGGRKKGVLSLYQFQQKAIVAGFSPKEASLLHESALASKLENPLEIFSSYKSLDIIIRSVMQKFLIVGKEKDPDGQEFLGKLLDLRKQITVLKLNARKKLSSSREITSGQEVQVVLAGEGIFATKVSSHDLYFAVLSPIVFDLSPDFRWESRRVMIFFPKRNDGEYCFNTTVVREIEDTKTGEFVLLMYHQETLSHTQKRQSIRVLLNKHAHIFPIGDGIGRSFAEGKPCTLYDISDDGCAVIMEGKIKMPKVVIIQFTLNNQLIGINGKCESIQYNKLRNASMLHIRANSIPRDTKNIILSVMFGLISKDDEPPVSDVPAENSGNSHEYPANQANAASDREKHAVVRQSEQGEYSSGGNVPAEAVLDNPPSENFAEDKQEATNTDVEIAAKEVPAE
jgi:c-di-GMP-binding flagellar brake protein YcgR